MRRLIALVISTGCAFFSVSCGGGGGPTFADMRWQMRCPSDLFGCSSGDPHDIFGFDQKENEGTEVGAVRAECAIEKAADGSRLLSFNAGVGSSTRIILNNAGFPDGGGQIQGLGCNLTFYEDGQEYRAVCGAGVPSDTQPCQIVGGVTLDRDDPDGHAVKLSILCRNITSPADPMRFRRDILAPMSTTEPAPIRFLDCDGF